MRWPIKTAVTVMVLLVGPSCDKVNPMQPPPPNHNPIISSLIAFPRVITPGDSTIVMASATDPDGDHLVYDWITDSRLVIKGNAPANHELFDSLSNLQIFYYGAIGPNDSAWVECDALDRKGGVAVKQTWIYTAP